MKIIDWKAYKEIPTKDLSNEELIKIIEDLQVRVKDLENRDTALPTFPNTPNTWYTNPCNIPTELTCEWVTCNCGECSMNN